MQIKNTFTDVRTFAPYSKILTGVNFVHVNGALDGKTSDPVSVLSILRQGKLLCPILLLIFINDLLGIIGSTVHLF